MLLSDHGVFEKNAPLATARSVKFGSNCLQTSGLTNSPSPSCFQTSLSPNNRFLSSFFAISSGESNLLFVNNKYPFRLACSSKNVSRFTPTNRNVSFHELEARLQSSDKPRLVFELFSGLDARRNCIAKRTTSIGVRRGQLETQR